MQSARDGTAGAGGSIDTSRFPTPNLPEKRGPIVRASLPTSSAFWTRILERVCRLQVLFEDIASEIVFQVTPDRVDVVALILSIVVLDEE